MNIGIDLDDTIAETADSFLKYAKKFNKDRKINYKIKQKEWDFDKAFGWNEQHIQDFIQEYLEELFIELEPKKDAVEIIKKLKEEGNQIIIITARSVDHVKNVKKKNERWLKKHNINFDKLETDAKNKAIKCEENSIDIFIDDGVYHCESVYNELKIPVLLMDSIYNKGYKNKAIKRVYNWQEIDEEINRIKGEKC